MNRGRRSFCLESAGRAGGRAARVALYRKLCYKAVE